MPAWNVHFEGLSALRRLLAFQPDVLKQDAFEGLVSGVQQGCRNARSSLAKNALLCVEDLFFIKPRPLKSLSSEAVASLVTTCLERCPPSQAKTVRTAALAAVDQMTAPPTELEVLALLWPAFLPHAGHKNKDVALQAMVSAEKVLSVAVKMDSEFVQQRVNIGQALSCLLLGINGKVPSGRSAAKLCCLTLVRSVGKESYQSAIEELSSLSQLQRDELSEAAGISIDRDSPAESAEEGATDSRGGSKHQGLPSSTLDSVDVEDNDSEDSGDSETDEELMAEIAASKGTTWPDQVPNTQHGDLKKASTEHQAQSIDVAFTVTFFDQTIDAFDSSVQLNFRSLTATTLEVAVDQVIMCTIQAGSVVVEVCVTSLNTRDDAVIVEDRASNPALLEAALSSRFGASKVWNKNWLGNKGRASKAESASNFASESNASVVQSLVEVNEREVISSVPMPSFSSVLGDDVEEWEKPQGTRAFVDATSSSGNAREVGASIEGISSPSVSLSAGLSSPLADEAAPEIPDEFQNEANAGEVLEANIDDDDTEAVIEKKEKSISLASNPKILPVFSSVLDDDVEEWEKPIDTRAYVDVRSRSDARELGASVEGVASPSVSLSTGLILPPKESLLGNTNEAATEATSDEAVETEKDDDVSEPVVNARIEDTPPTLTSTFSSVLGDDMEEWEKPKDTRAYVDAKSSNGNARGLRASVEGVAPPSVSMSADLSSPTVEGSGANGAEAAPTEAITDEAVVNKRDDDIMNTTVEVKYDGPSHSITTQQVSTFSSALSDDVEEWEKPKNTRAFVDATSSSGNARELGVSIEGLASPSVSLSAGLTTPLNEEANAVPEKLTSDPSLEVEPTEMPSPNSDVEAEEKSSALNEIAAADEDQVSQKSATEPDKISSGSDAKSPVQVDEKAAEEVSNPADSANTPNKELNQELPGETTSPGADHFAHLPAENSAVALEPRNDQEEEEEDKKQETQLPAESSTNAAEPQNDQEEEGEDKKEEAQLPAENSAVAVEPQSDKQQEEDKKLEAQRRADAYVARAKAKVEAQKLQAEQEAEAATQAKALQDAKDAEAAAAASEAEAAAAQLAEEERVAAEAAAADAAAVQAAAEAAAAEQARQEAAAAAEAERAAAAARAEEEAKAAAQAQAEKGAALLEASKAKARARASPPRDQDELDAPRSRDRALLQSPSIDDPPDVRLENIRSRVASANSSVDRLPTPVKGSPLPSPSSSSSSLSMSAKPKSKNRRVSSTSTHGFALLQSGVGTYLAMNFEAPNAPLPVRAMTLDPDGVPVMGMLWQLMPDRTLQNRATGYILEIEGLKTGRKIPVVCGERTAGYTRKGVADAAQWSLTAENELVNRSNGYLLTVRNGSSKTRAEVWCNYKVPLIGTTAAQRWFFRPYEGEPKTPLYPINPKFEHLFKNQADTRFGTNI